MKTKTLLAALLCVLGFETVCAQNSNVIQFADTTIHWKNTVIEVTEKDKQYEVEIMKKKQNGDTILLKQVFKGIYEDGYNNEKRVFDAHVKLPVWDLFERKEPKSKHWRKNLEMLGIGFSKLMVQGDYNLSISNRSNRFSLGFLQCCFYKNKTSFLLSTSFDFNRIYFSNNNFLQMNENGVTVPMKASPEVVITRSKLRMAYFNMYAGFEYELFRQVDIQFYGGVKLLMSSYNKVTTEGYGVRSIPANQNLSSVLPEFGCRIKCYTLGFMVNYSPCSIFKKDKGPDMKMLTMGVTIFW